MKTRSALTALKFLFLTVAAVVAADLVALGLHTARQEAPRTDVVPRAVSASPSTLPTSADQLVQDTRKLLGDAPPVGSSGAALPGSRRAKAAATPETPAPDPAQSMILLGTISAPGASVAFLQVQGKEVTVHDGSQIGGFTVMDIRTSSVLFRWGSTKQTKMLWLPSMAPSPSPSAGHGLGLLPPPPVPVAESPSPAPGRTVVMSRADVNAAMAHPDTYMKQMRILPITRNDQPYGMQVDWLDPGSLLSRMGLRTGDLLLSINGSNLYTPAQALNAYQVIEHDDHVAFKIERGGVPQTLEVDIR